MKVRIIFTFFFLSIISSLHAQVNLDQGLVGYYSFDNGGAQDQSSGNLNSMVYGNPSPVPGISGSAFFFDGIDDYIEIPNGLNFQEDFTITMWVNAITQGALISKGEVCPDGNPNFQGNSYGLALGREYTGCFSADPNTSFHLRGLLIETGGNFFDDRIIVSTKESVIQPGAFTFLAYCYDATTKKFGIQLNGIPLLDTELNHFYEDGGSTFCKAISPDDISNAHQTTSSLTIGARKDWCNRIFKINGFYEGTIDEVRFYDRKLNPEELEELGKTGLQTVPTLSEWAIFILGLLILTVGTISFLVPQIAFAPKGTIHLNYSILFRRASFSRTFQYTGLLYLVGFILILLIWETIVPIDLIGMTISIILITYLLHFFID